MEQNLVIPIRKTDKILDYQVEMLIRNHIPYILSFEKRLVNEETAFYYRTGSMIPLTQYLQGTVLKRNDFLIIMESISKSLTDCIRFLLYDHCFLLEMQYIYIHPVTKAIALVYLPLEVQKDVKSRLKELVTSLLSALNPEKNSEDIQLFRMVMDWLSNDCYDLTEFIQLLKEIRFSKYIVRIDKFETLEKPFRLEPDKETNESAHCDKFMGSIDISGREQFSKKKIYIFGLALLQLIFFAVLTLVSDRLKAMGDITTTYAGIALILAAVNVLFINKIFKKSFSEKERTAKRKNKEDNMLREWRDMLTYSLARENNLLQKEIEKK